MPCMPSSITILCTYSNSSLLLSLSIAAKAALVSTAGKNIDVPGSKEGQSI